MGEKELQTNYKSHISGKKIFLQLDTGRKFLLRNQLKLFQEPIIGEMYSISFFEIGRTITSGLYPRWESASSLTLIIRIDINSKYDTNVWGYYCLNRDILMSQKFDYSCLWWLGISKSWKHLLSRVTQGKIGLLKLVHKKYNSFWTSASIALGYPGRSSLQG